MLMLGPLARRSVVGGSVVHVEAVSVIVDTVLNKAHIVFLLAVSGDAVGVGVILPTALVTPQTFALVGPRKGEMRSPVRPDTVGALTVIRLQPVELRASDNEALLRTHILVGHAVVLFGCGHRQVLGIDRRPLAIDHPTAVGRKYQMGDTLP